MMRTIIFSFSDQGKETAKRVSSILWDHETELYAPRGNLQELVTRLFPAADAMIFIGACGIAVRAIAPHLVSKASDPAVLVIDERGNFVVSLLSGHLGGANDLSRQIGESLGATPVITTATDVNHRFSADAWAAKQGLILTDLKAAKRFSAEILKRDLPLRSDFPVKAPLPEGLRIGINGDCGLVISCRKIHPFETTLLLTPRILHLGIGCKRGTPPEQIEAAVRAAMRKKRLRREAVIAAASIDLKQDEPGLLSWAEWAGIPMRFYAAEELNAVPGEFTASEFVRQTTGVDCVCERAALLDAGTQACLVARKYTGEGVTVAVAREDWRVHFA